MSEILPSGNSLFGRPADVGHSTKVGRLEVLNGHGGLRGTFWEVNGTKWIYLFRGEHLEVLADAWMHKVKITGRTIEEEGRDKQLEVDPLFVIEDDLGEETGAGEGRAGHSGSQSHWKNSPKNRASHRYRRRKRYSLSGP